MLSENEREHTFNPEMLISPTDAGSIGRGRFRKSVVTMLSFTCQIHVPKKIFRSGNIKL